MANAERGWIAFLNETLRLPQERPYLAIDLFAGCGGLSLGFECAGVKTIGYEMKPECCPTSPNALPIPRSKPRRWRCWPRRAASFERNQK